MTSKKPLPAPSTVVTVSTQPPARKRSVTSALNQRQQPDNRWQRTKRYGWDSR